jgi:hypothetical protein
MTVFFLHGVSGRFAAVMNMAPIAAKRTRSATQITGVCSFQTAKSAELVTLDHSRRRLVDVIADG